MPHSAVLAVLLLAAAALVAPAHAAPCAIDGLGDDWEAAPTSDEVQLMAAVAGQQYIEALLGDEDVGCTPDYSLLNADVEAVCTQGPQVCAWS